MIINNIEWLLNIDNNHFNINRLLSYNDIYFYIIKGGRGIGKTTNLLIHFIKQAINKGVEFVYLRRYETELSKSKHIFDKILKGVTTKGLGKGAYEYLYKGKRMGYALCLSKQQTYKSGLDTSKVGYLLFDETFLLSGGVYRYLKEETNQLLELISTIFRERESYKVFLVGNNMDFLDPYSTYFNLPIIKDRYIDSERGLYVEYAKTKKELQEIEKKTPLYNLTKNTTYHEYHYNNKPLTTIKNIRLGVKEPKSYYYCRFVYENNTITLYLQGKNAKNIFVDYDNKKIVDKTTFILQENNKPNYAHLTQLKASNIGKVLTNYYYNNDMIYVNEIANNLMEMIITTYFN